MATNGTGFGFGLTVSNSAIGAGALVVLGAIGAHLVSNLFAQGRAVKVANKTSEPTMVEAMYGEALALATNPSTVEQNRDRVNQAIKQRRDHLKALREKIQTGRITEHELATGIQKEAQDVLEDLGIPQHPHPLHTPADLHRGWNIARREGLERKFAIPGGLILDPAERAWLERQSMSYQGHVDPVNRAALQDSIKKQLEQQRLAILQREKAQRAMIPTPPTPHPVSPIPPTITIPGTPTITPPPFPAFPNVPFPTLPPQTPPDLAAQLRGDYDQRIAAARAIYNAAKARYDAAVQTTTDPSILAQARQQLQDAINQLRQLQS